MFDGVCVSCCCSIELKRGRGGRGGTANERAGGRAERRMKGRVEIES